MTNHMYTCMHLCTWDMCVLLILLVFKVTGNLFIFSNGSSSCSSSIQNQWLVLSLCSLQCLNELGTSDGCNSTSSSGPSTCDCTQYHSGFVLPSTVWELPHMLPSWLSKLTSTRYISKLYYHIIWHTYSLTVPHLEATQGTHLEWWVLWAQVSCLLHGNLAVSSASQRDANSKNSYQLQQTVNSAVVTQTRLRKSYVFWPTPRIRYWYLGYSRQDMSADLTA